MIEARLSVSRGIYEIKNYLLPITPSKKIPNILVFMYIGKQSTSGRKKKLVCAQIMCVPQMLTNLIWFKKSFKKAEIFYETKLQSVQQVILYDDDIIFWEALSEEVIYSLQVID